MTEKTITTVNKEEFVPVAASQITDEQLFNDYAYIMVQKQAEMLRDNRLLSVDEFNNLSALNREKFCPFMSEVMADIT